jgi:rubredoxin
MSEYAWVEYWRCDDCGHVWTNAKGDPEGPRQDITIPPQKADGR